MTDCSQNSGEMNTAYAYAASSNKSTLCGDETDAEEDETSSICLKELKNKSVHDFVSIYKECSDAEKLLTHFASKHEQKISIDDVDNTEPAKKKVNLSGLIAWTAEKADENEARWMAKFELLKKYKAKHGDCLVRKRDKTLGQWVYDQKKHYRLLKEGKKAKISQDRIEMLESIGFAWSSMSNHFVKYDKLWMSKFEELKRFMEVNGDRVVPEKGTHLCKWIENQRYQHIGFRKGKQSRLTQERVDLLNSVGFIWRKEIFDDDTCTTVPTVS